MAYEVSPADFVNLPLGEIIANPLVAAVQAQARAAETTRAFIEALYKNKVSFQVKQNDNGKEVDTTIQAPLLSMVPVPHLQIDSLSIQFKYCISQVYETSENVEKELAGEVGTTGLVSKFVKVDLKGTIGKETSTEFTSSKSGQLEIKVHASESTMPKGLEKILDLLADTIPVKKK